MKVALWFRRMLTRAVLSIDMRDLYLRKAASKVVSFDQSLTEFIRPLHYGTSENE